MRQILNLIPCVGGGGKIISCIAEKCMHKFCLCRLTSTYYFYSSAVPWYYSAQLCWCCQFEICANVKLHSLWLLKRPGLHWWLMEETRVKWLFIFRHDQNFVSTFQHLSSNSTNAISADESTMGNCNSFWLTNLSKTYRTNDTSSFCCWIHSSGRKLLKCDTGTLCLYVCCQLSNFVTERKFVNSWHAMFLTWSYQVSIAMNFLLTTFSQFVW